MFVESKQQVSRKILLAEKGLMILVKPSHLAHQDLKDWFQELKPIMLNKCTDGIYSLLSLADT